LITGNLGGPSAFEKNAHAQAEKMYDSQFYADFTPIDTFSRVEGEK
jgi:hypothetical protein